MTAGSLTRGATAFKNDFRNKQARSYRLGFKKRNRKKGNLLQTGYIIRGFMQGTVCKLPVEIIPFDIGIGTKPAPSGQSTRATR